MRVTADDFVKAYGVFADRARQETVTITSGGQDSLVVISADEYARLTRRDRRAIRPQDMTPEEVAAVGQAEVPPE